MKENFMKGKYEGESSTHSEHSEDLGVSEIEYLLKEILSVSEVNENLKNNLEVKLYDFLWDVSHLSSEQAVRYNEDQETAEAIKKSFPHYDELVFDLNLLKKMNEVLENRFEKTIKVLEELTKNGIKNINFTWPRDKEFLEIMNISDENEKKESLRAYREEKIKPVLRFAIGKKEVIEKKYKELFG